MFMNREDRGPWMWKRQTAPGSVVACFGTQWMIRLVGGFVFATMVSAAALGQDSTDIWPSPNWHDVDPISVGLDAKALTKAKRYSLSAGGSGIIIWQGNAVMRWGDQKLRYDIKSATKSFGSTMLGIAVKDTKVDLSDRAHELHHSFGIPPASNAQTDWLKRITLQHLATQTAGFEKRGGYEKLLFEPGSHWHYSDGGPNWLAECLTLKYGRDLNDVMFERVFLPIGISREDLHWRRNQYRAPEIDGVARREFGAGIHANVEAMSRFGYLHLREGRWKDRQLLPKTFVQIASRPIQDVVGIAEWEPGHGNASDHYGLLWWNNADKTLSEVPPDAYWAWGLYDSLIVVVPSQDLVVVRAGARGKQLARKENGNHYDVLGPLLSPIVSATRAAALARSSTSAPPYPKSDFISGIEWAPKEKITRKASGSDNWPITWGDDDLLYTAYGDGWGFEPKTPEKLSLGLASVHGSPENFRGTNIRTGDAERVGQGEHGQKASGMLMVEGVLYMLARNAGNSQLSWSDDRGKSWKLADWKWKTSFGCPTFLNFGKNYSDRPKLADDFVYMYSHDSASAYEASDQMVLARVRKHQIRSRDAYEFFAGIQSESGAALWTDDIKQRQAVFGHKGNCYRSGITYNAGLKRFLWCHTLPASTDSRGPRFQGGLGIYESRTPWGPWKTVFYTTNWDVGPGETSRFPTKWMSEDGRSAHLVFSGDDCFSVRHARFITR